MEEVEADEDMRVHSMLMQLAPADVSANFSSLNNIDLFVFR